MEQTHAGPCHVSQMHHAASYSIKAHSSICSFKTMNVLGHINAYSSRAKCHGMHKGTARQLLPL
jgi:hypothetical protein